VSAAEPDGPRPEPGQGPSDPEDRKILTLARAARARTGAQQGGCVRDTDGRTYAATSVDLPHLKLSAVQVALAMAVSSGAPGLEAVATAGGEPTNDDLAAVADLAGTTVTVWVADQNGSVTGVREAQAHAAS